MLRLVLAAAHLIALGIGLGSVWARARALRAAARDGAAGAALAAGDLTPGGLSPERLRPAFEADNWWGVAAVLWLGTGLWRALAGTEKTPSYYAHNVVLLGQDGSVRRPAGS